MRKKKWVVTKLQPIFKSKDWFFIVLVDLRLEDGGTNAIAQK